MHILLAPPFLLQKFCRHCLRIYYRDNPDGWVWRHEVEKMPPLGSYDSVRGFIPDYPVLSMFDEFTIDAEACERLSSKTAPHWYGSWPEVIQLLKAEGALSLVDIQSELAATASVRGTMLKRDMRDVTRWSHAMSYCDTLLASADEALSPKPTSAQNLSWHYDSSKTPGVKGSDGHNHILSAGPLVDSVDDPHDPHHELHQMAVDELRIQLREVNAGIAVAMRLNCAPMFWAPYKVYLEEKMKSIMLLKNSHEHAEAARLFFEIAFPRFKPVTVKDFARLRKDRRLQQLRTVILSSARTGKLMDPQYPQKIIEEVFKLEKKIGRVRQIVGWISTAVGLIPVPGLGAVTAATGELASTGIEHWFRKDWNWFYLVSDGTGHS